MRFQNFRIRLLPPFLVCALAWATPFAARSQTAPSEDHAETQDKKTTAHPDPMVVRVRSPSSDFNWNESTTPTYARLGDTIIIDVRDLDAWMHQMKTEGKIKDEGIDNLVPLFNGVALWGVHPENPGAGTEDLFVGNDNEPHQSHHLRFTLSRLTSEESRNAWSRLLNQPVRNRRVRVSVGFENGLEMPTWVDAVDKRGAFQFYLTIMPAWPLFWGTVVIIGSLVIFLMLAARTDIVRDTLAPLRPDGKKPFSLGRVQMAFWFFLIISGYFSLWVVTGDTDTLNTSALALMGISAGTALGSAIIDAGKNSPDELDRLVVHDAGKSNPRELAARLKSDLDREREVLANLQAQRVTLVATQVAEIKESELKLVASKDRLELLRKQHQFFTWRPWKAVLYDLLGEDNVITFHRFQIFVWTLVLGIIFANKVYNELSMPEFSSTMLGLLGISAGTYLGFKFPERAPKTA